MCLMDSWTQIRIGESYLSAGHVYSLIIGHQFCSMGKTWEDDFKNKGSEFGWFHGALSNLIGNMMLRFRRLFGFFDWFCFWGIFLIDIFVHG